MSLCAARLDLFHQLARAVPSVSNDVIRAGEAVDQIGRCGSVIRLVGANRQPDRQARLIDNGVDFRTQSPTRAADGVIFTPLFPPAECWWARMMELSMNTIASGD